MKQIAIIAAVLMIFGQACTESNGKEQPKKAKEMEQISAKDYTTFKVSDNISCTRSLLKTCTI